MVYHDDVPRLGRLEGPGAQMDRPRPAVVEIQADGTARPTNRPGAPKG